jgi:Tfp pilus assembly major pilin PilA
MVFIQPFLPLFSPPLQTQSTGLLLGSPWVYATYSSYSNSTCHHAIHENRGAMECKAVAQNATNEKDIEFKKCEEHISHDSEQQC